MLDAIAKRSHCFVIAEIGVNHNGHMGLAYAHIDAAREAGVDAVKFQLFEPTLLTTAQAPLAAYQQKALGQSTDFASLESPQQKQSGPVATSQQAMLASLVLTPQQMKQLQAYCSKSGLLFLCTPFDSQSAEFLVQDLQVPLLKLSSGDLTNLPFLAQLAKEGTPLILSTGMGSLEEVQQAVETIATYTSRPLPEALAILHCTSLYPAAPDTLNLRAIQTLQKQFPSLVVGYSDHSLGVEASYAVVAMGARILEKHLTLDANLPGPDHQASLPAERWPDWMQRLRMLEQMLGDGRKQPHPREEEVASVARKSLVLARDLPQGHTLTLEDLLCKRPGQGIAPARLSEVLGNTLRHALPQDSLITWDDLNARVPQGEASSR
jgi:N,N'-diacetyllegionaminate synthase